MAKVELKKPIVEEISNTIQDAKSAVLVDFRGLTVEQDTRLRKSMREAGYVYKVYKNTMIRFAVKDTPFEPLEKHLEGPTALAVSKDDVTGPASMLKNFSKEAPALEIKAGIIEGEYYDAEGVLTIASIPPRDVLLGRLLGSMKSPIANLARVLNQIAEAGGGAAAAKPEEEAQAPAEEAKPGAETEAPAEEAKPEEEAQAPAEEAKPEAETEAPAEETPAE